MAQDKVRTTESQRAEHLWRVRDLVTLGVKQRIYRRSELYQVAVEEKAFRTNRGKPFLYTSIYRYLDALRFLLFDESEKYGFDDEIIWSPSAIELATYGEANYGTVILSEPEKMVFRANIFLSDVREQFLTYFFDPVCTSFNQEQFVTMARSLYVINQSVKRPDNVTKSEAWPAEENVEIDFDPEGRDVIRRPKREFLYTYRYWCLDTNIIDELNVYEAERYRIPKSQAYILFPIDPAKQITPDQFLEIIHASVGHTLKQPQVIPIPWLMYYICPKAKISIETFKILLLETWQQKRHLLHLERGPGALIAGKINASEREYKERYGNHRYYPVVDGTIRSNIAIFPVE